MLLSPAAVGIVGYFLAWRSGAGRPEQYLSMLYADDLTPLALPLPIHYLSAGVLGVTMGLGIAAVIANARIVSMATARA
jgi:hypothetical protein